MVEVFDILQFVDWPSTLELPKLFDIRLLATALVEVEVEEDDEEGRQNSII